MKRSGCYEAHAEGTVAARRVFCAYWIDKLRRGHGPKTAKDSPSPQGRGPGSTAIELGACCSKHDFFDPPLKMIRTIQRQLRPGRFALGPHGDSSAQEHTLELFNYLLDRKLAVKQIQQLVFQGVISYRAVHLLGMFVPSALLPQNLPRRLRQHALHIAQEQRRKKILTHRFGCLSAKILQIQPTL